MGQKLSRPRRLQLVFSWLRRRLHPAWPTFRGGSGTVGTSFLTRP